MQLIKYSIFFFSALLIVSTCVAQKPKSEIVLHLNTPISFTMGDFAKNNKAPLGASFMGRFYVSKLVAITPSVRFDNFVDRLSNTRSENYLQYKVGLTYEDNFLGKLMGKYWKFDWLSSYSIVDFGIASKVKSKSEGKKSTFAYSIGYGFKARLSKKSFIDNQYNWGSFGIPNSVQGSCFDFRLGVGLYL